MTDKLIPKNPAACSVIRAVSPRITTVSAPFRRFGHFKVGGRGTIVRLSDASLAVFSPTALTAEVRRALDAAGGNVQYLVAPDIEHHIFLGEWSRAFPAARVLGPEGLPEKREADAATAGTRFSHVWTAGNKADMRVDAAFDADFACEFVHSHGNRELVFLFRPERTLIQADLIFNLPAYEQYSRAGEPADTGLPTRLFIGLMNTRGDARWQRRFLWYAAAAKDRKGFAASIRRINAWDFDRIIPCHGDVIETGGKAVFQTVMEWHLKTPQ